MPVRRYPVNALAGDYIRSGAGFLCTVLPVVWLRPIWPLIILLLAIAGLCGYLLVRTFERSRATVSYDEQGIMYQAFTGASFPWDDLSSMILAYYAVRRDKSDGWMQLTLKAGGRSIKVDSRLDGFVDLVRQATRAAKQNMLPLNEITQANLRALRIH